ncbi:MAG: tyrosine-type recombinase/integrase [Nocardioidaceae bacterium]
MSETSFDVRIWSIHRYEGARGTTFTVKWRVGGAKLQRTFATLKLAEAFRSTPTVAAREGQPFHVANGLPASMQTKTPACTWLGHAMAYVSMKWPRASARHRRGIAEALTDVTLALIESHEGCPDESAVRRVLYRWAFNAPARDNPVPDELRTALLWLERHTPTLDDLSQAARLRAVLDQLALRQDGKPAAPSTVARKRATLHNALEYAVELELFSSNPLGKVRWSAPRGIDVVDRRVVVNPDQARRLLDAVWKRDPAVAGFFACMYYAGLRPAEARNLRWEDCTLPDTGWGQFLLAGSHQTSGAAWTDSAKSGEDRSLKHRGVRDTRLVPVHPELVAALRRHLEHFQTGVDGLLFVTRTARAGVPIAPPYVNPVSMSTVYRAWQQARSAALSEREARSMLARRPYDLRHACLSTWLNAGVPPARVAEWAGHSVDVLLRVYAKCVDGDDQIAMRRIEAALG